MIPAGRLAGSRRFTVLSLTEAEGNPRVASTGLSGSTIRPSISETASNMVDHIGILCKEGQLEEALYIFSVVCEQGLKLYSGVYFCLLQGCGQARALAEGRHIHFYMTQTGCKLNVYLGNALMSMYINCGCIVDACKVFDSLPERNVFTWTVIISGYVKSDYAEEALRLFEQMEQYGMPDDVCFVTVLNACAKLRALEKGRHTHDSMVKLGITEEKVVGNTLIDMYCKCGSFQDANLVFDRIQRDEVSWNALISGCAQHGLAKEAWGLFKRMEEEKVKLGKVTFLSILKVCETLNDCWLVHLYLCENGLDSDLCIRSTLLNMYIGCGSIKDAEVLFLGTQKADVVLCNALLTGYVKQEQGNEALALLKLMDKKGLRPNDVSFIGALQACASLMSFEAGKLIHSQLVRNGCDSDTLFGSMLVDMYSKCRSIDDACSVFDSLRNRNVFTWTAMMTGYTQDGHGEAALHSFEQMRVEGLEVDEFCFVNGLNSCASLERGRLLHVHILASVHVGATFVGCALINMYIKCGSLQDAEKVFETMPQRDACIWSQMIGGYVKHGQAERALELFQHLEMHELDDSIFSSIVNACATLAAIEQGKHVHSLIIQSGFDQDIYVGSALVDMYAKCGIITSARKVFDKMPEQDVVSWSAMIAGCVQHGQADEALRLWMLMEQGGMHPDEFTFVSILNVCAGLAALELGKHIHAHFVGAGIKLTALTGAAVVDMYGKCGSLDIASEVFEQLIERDVSAWNSIITAYCQHGKAKEVIRLVEQMQQSGIGLDHITSVCVLSALGHSGLAREGLHYFDLMTNAYGIMPTIEHYSSMVDLLGRAGHLSLAYESIENAPSQPGASTWRAMLGASRIHGDLDLAACAAKHVLELEPHDTAAFVLLANAYVHS